MNFVTIKTFLLRLFHVRHYRPGFESPRYLLKWLFLSTLIGGIAGLGAIAFYAAIHFATDFFLGTLVGYIAPSPSGEGEQSILMSFWSSSRPWLLPVITTLGALLSGMIVFRFAPEAEGHGTDAAIAAFHHGTPIRARIPLIKLIASAITIGSGGSAGREGPAAQISAGFGSLLANALHLDAQDRRIALATGIGAGIGAIFRAPLGGALLAAEILYKDDLEMEAVIPSLMASIVGYSIFGSWSGWQPIFGTPKNLAFTSPPQLLYYVVLGILCGLLGLLYARGFYGITHIFHRLPLPAWFKPAIGGLLVGLIGLAMPQALGMGYGWVQVSMGSSFLSLPLWIILLLPFAKIITTSLSIGSGGSGGIFGPGMVIGGLVGAGFWRLCYHVLPGLPDTPAPFVIVGMMALFGGIAHAPLAVMLMVAEMTGNLSMLAPAMISVGIATILVGKTTMYTSQVPTRADSPAHRFQLSFPLLSTLSVRNAMTVPPVLLSPGQFLSQAEHMLAEHHVDGAPVLDQGKHFIGIMTLADIERIPHTERMECFVSDVMRTDPLTFSPEDTLDEALEALSSHHVSWIPVVASEGLLSSQQLLGVLSVSQIVSHYREATSKDVRRMRGLVEGTVLIEAVIEPDMLITGIPLRDAHLPAETLVVAIQRANTPLFPRGSCIIEAGDLVSFMVSIKGEQSLQHYLAQRKTLSPPVKSEYTLFDR